MSDRALTAKQYAEILQIGYSTFRSAYAAHPDQFAPSFEVGSCRRWWESTVVAYHKGQERQEGEAVLTLTS